MGKFGFNLFRKVIFVCLMVVSTVARAELKSTKFPDAHGNASAIAANSQTVVVGTDFGYLEILDRQSGSFKSVQIYNGPYRANAGIGLSGAYAYALTNGYSLVKSDHLSFQKKNSFHYLIHS